MSEAIILAGGYGTRLREVVPDLPKPMAPINGRPFLEVLFDNFVKKGFKRLILSLGYRAEKIIQHFGSDYAGIELVYVIEEEPLGTGGGIRLAMEKCHQDYVFIFNGDTFLDLEVAAVQEKCSRNQRSIIVGREVEDTARYGAISSDHGVVTGFSEKGASGPGLINAGCYVLNKQDLVGFPINTSFSLEQDFLPGAVENRNMDLFVTSGQFIDIGVPEDYERAQHELDHS